MIYYSGYTPANTGGGVHGASLVDLTSTSFAQLFAQAANYNNIAGYSIGDLVYDQNAIWVCVQATTGNAPPTLPTLSNAYWEFVGSQGTFMWIAYANSADGTVDFTTGAADTGGISRKYIGIASNKTTATESATPADYAWSKFVGDNGTIGVSPIYISISRPAVTVPTDSDGNNGVFTGSGTTISVYEGQTLLEYDASGLSNSTWKISNRVATNVVVGTIAADTASYATVNDITAISGDTGSIVYTITGKNSSGVAFSITTTQTFSRVKGAIVDTTPPAQVTGLALTTTTETLPGGNIQAKLKATWSANVEADLAYYEAQIKATTGGTYVGHQTTTTSYEWIVPANTSYTVQVRAIDKSDNRGTFSTATVLTSGIDSTAPGLPTAIDIKSAFKNTFITWTNTNGATDTDLAAVEVWVNTTNSSGTATKIATVNAVKGTPGGFTHSGISTATIYYYFLKSVDTSGNTSGFTSTVSATTNQSSVTLASGGAFTFTGNTTPLAVGKVITISGALGGTGGITGYSNPTSYIISSTNGTTTATLVALNGAALTTTAGTPTGLTYTVLTSATAPGAIGNSDIIAGTITADRIQTGTLTGDQFNTGTYLPGTVTVGATGVSIGTVKTNTDTALSGTLNYRTTGAPTNNPSPTAITKTENTNGTRNIKLDWGSYTQGANKADFLFLFWNKTTTAPTVNDAAITFNVNTTGASYYVFEGVNPADTFSFGIAAARRTENGIEIGTIQAPTTAPQWVNVTATTANYTANIGGSAAASVVADASLGAQNPATRINSGSTTIDPGKILISGATTLANWRNGTDATKIEGGSIAANTVSANKLEVGLRGLSISGIEFQATANTDGSATNTVTWSNGTIIYTDNAGAVTSIAISGGSYAWASGIVYIYWNQGDGTLGATTTSGTAYGPTKIVLATYAGGFNLVANYGRTIVDGSQITTGTINADRLKTNTTITQNLQVGSTNFQIKGSNIASGKGTLVVSNGTAEVLRIGYLDASYVGLELKDAGGATVLSSKAPVAGGSSTNTYASAISNSSISISSNGTLSGGGGGQVSITGLGYTGDLSATNDLIMTLPAIYTKAGNTITRNSGAGSAWDTSAYTTGSYTGGAFVECQHNGNHWMIGLNSDPSTALSYSSIDYAFHGAYATGYIYLNGSNVWSGAIASTAICTVAYDGVYVRFLVDGTIVYSVSATSALKLYGQVSLYYASEYVRNIRFGPLSSNDWAAVGGTNKPADNANNTYVSGTAIYGVSSGSGTAVVNTGITLNSNGSISGAGGGSVTIGGLGYTGDLAANQTYISGTSIYGVSAGSGTAVANTGITMNSNGSIAGAGGGSVTIGGLGYTGDLNATYGVPASYFNSTNVSNYFGLDTFTSTRVTELFAADSISSTEIASLAAGKIAAGTITVGVNLGSAGKIIMDGVNNRIVITD